MLDTIQRTSAATIRYWSAMDTKFLEVWRLECSFVSLLLHSEKFVEMRFGLVKPEAASELRIYLQRQDDPAVRVCDGNDSD